MTIIRRIIQYAAERNIPKKKIAAVCDVTPSRISTWVSADVDSIPSKSIPLLASLFNVSCDELLTGEKDLSLSDDQRRVLSIFDSLDRDGQIVVLATIIQERRRVTGETVDLGI